MMQNTCMGLCEYPHKDMAYVAPFYHCHFTLQQQSHALLKRVFFSYCNIKEKNQIQLKTKRMAALELIWDYEKQKKSFFSPPRGIPGSSQTHHSPLGGFCFVLFRFVSWLVGCCCCCCFFGLLLAAIEVRALNSIKALPIQESALCRYK